MCVCVCIETRERIKCAMICAALCVCVCVEILKEKKNTCAMLSLRIHIMMLPPPLLL